MRTVLTRLVSACTNWRVEVACRREGKCPRTADDGRGRGTRPNQEVVVHVKRTAAASPPLPPAHQEPAS